MNKYITSILTLVLALNVYAGDYYQSGKISNLTAVSNGVMIMLDSGLPTNCTGTPYGWMLVKQENTALVSVVLASWVSGKTSGTVYTSGSVNGDYCIVTQFDPDN